MALNERACGGKRGGEGLADLDAGDRQCTCRLTQEKIESIVLKKDPDADLFGWKCPDCNHSFGKHATSNFHILRSKLSWYCPHIRSGHSVVCAQVQPLPLRPVRVLYHIYFFFHLLGMYPPCLDQRLLCVLVWTWSSCSYVMRSGVR